MKRIKHALIALSALAIAALTAVTANASLLIEPHLGYNIYGNADYQSASIKYNGAQYGARLGGQYLGLMGGFDYTHSSFTYKTTGAADSDKTRNQFGVFVGYNLPVFVRAWFGYYFSDKLTTTSNSSWIKGNGTELGLGFTGIPFLSINLQYRMSTYDETSTGGALTPNAKPKEFVLGVSAPFTLL